MAKAKNELLLLKGVKEITQRFELTKNLFYTFIKLGMPVRLINGRWYGYASNIEDFFKTVTVGKPIAVDSNDPCEYAGIDNHPPKGWSGLICIGE